MTSDVVCDEIVQLFPKGLLGFVFAYALPSRSGDFRLACAEGDLPAARVAATLLGLTREEARSCHNIALADASQGGHMATVCWLVAHFELGLADVREANVFGIAWERCDQELIAWYSTQFGRAAVHSERHLPYEICVSHQRGRTGFARWAMRHFGLSLPSFELTTADICGHYMSVSSVTPRTSLRPAVISN